MSDEFDAVIIGSGLGGLTAGARLSAAGKKVIVLEQHSQAGGFATSFKRKDFIFDVSMHNIGPLKGYKTLYDILLNLGITDDFEYVKFDGFQHLKFSDNDISIPAGFDNYRALLQESFPAEYEGINTLFDLMEALNSEIMEIEKYGVFLDKITEKFPLFSLKFPNLVTLTDKTALELVNDYISDERLKGILLSTWWICGMPPSELAAILFCIVTYRYCHTGGGAIKGTSFSLTTAFVKKIRDSGSTVLLKSRVDKVIVDNGHVTGVMLKNGKVYNAPVVVANCSPLTLFLEMIESEHIKKSYLKKIKKMEPSLSAVQLFLGLDKDPFELGMDKPCVVAFDRYSHDDSYKNIFNRNQNSGFIALTSYSSFDDSVAKKGKAVLNIMTLDSISNWKGLSKFEYQAKKEQVKKQLIKKAGQIVAGIDSHIEVAVLATPLTMERYTGHTDGAIYGFAQTNSQSGINRLTSQTPIKGLYLAGAYTYPGAGYSSVILSGYGAAGFIIATDKKKC